jgi:hypothetical protein
MQGGDAMNRAYRIDSTGKLHFVASRRRTDTAPTERNDIAGVLIWLLIGIALWLVTTTAGNAYVRHVQASAAAAKASACIAEANRLGIAPEQCP